jgi:hypothetical protein
MDQAHRHNQKLKNDIETGCYCKILAFRPNKILLFHDTFGIKKLSFGLLKRNRQAIKNGVYKGLWNAHK